MVDATRRFTSRVENYKLYRPGYPAALVEFLRRNCELSPAARIADVGSGTGLLSRVFLDAGFSVVGIEPNRAMREAGEPGALDATAEATTLPDKSIDLVVAGQAFHWFDPPRARTEWLRILRPPAYVALIWNERFDETPFMKELGAMIDRCAAARDGDGTIRKAGKDRIPGFFAPQPYRVEEFPNQQIFDFDALLGRVVSSSYLPNEGDADYAPLVADVREIFDRWQQAGTVQFEYRTRAYWGTLLPPLPH
jgi:SAM-dependent methyltransferase